MLSFTDFIQADYSLYSTFVVLILSFLILRAGVRKGLEKLNNYLVPLFMASLIILFFGSLSTGGLDNAINFYFTINPEYFFNTSTWILAFSQAFFSLGVGWCLMLTYSGYLTRKVNIIGSSSTISIIDTLIALVAGFMVFSLAFGGGIPIESGPSLAFDSLPKVLDGLPLTEIALPLFFLLLFTAALTSAVSMMEVPITMLEDEFSISRKKAVILIILLFAVVSIPNSLSYSSYGFEVFGMPFLDFLDWYVVGQFAPLAVLVTTMLLAWGYKDLEKQLRKMMSPILSKCFLIFVRFVIPIFLIGLFLVQFLI